MAGYGVAEAKMRNEKPQADVYCTLCDDTGLITTGSGLRQCPQCEDEIAEVTEESHAEIS